MKVIAAVSALSLLTLPVAAQESMAKAAERQKKARKGQTKVITEDELRNLRTKGYVAPSVDGAAAPAPTAPGAAPAAKEKSDEEQRAEKKAAIEKKIREQSEYAGDIRKQLDDAQVELNDLSTMTLGGRRTELMRLLDEGKKKIAELEQGIADLQEQARRAGIAVSR
jgi:predicted  nucleic acid-binding Zn-ribbon protein